MSGTASVPNTFATQLGNVPAAQLDANWTSLINYINTREITSGTLAARPLTPSNGSWYFATDDSGGTLYFSAATGWVKASLGLNSSETLTAPLVLQDATSGNLAHPFIEMQKVGSETWRVFYQRPTFFGNSSVLSFAPSGNGAALQFSLIAADGGQRVAVWDSSTTLPLVPHTSILPTFAVFGDILIGDIVALGSNPQTLFIRANANLPVSAITQLFSATKAAGVEPDGGAQVILAPFKNGGGAVSDGFVQLVAYGGGSGASANEIQFKHRQGSSTVATTWHIGGGAEAALYPDADAAMDIGTAAKRVRSEYIVAIFGDNHTCKATSAGSTFPGANTPVAVPMATEDYDSEGMHSTVTNTSRITAVTSGVYICAANIVGTTNVAFTGNVIDYEIKVNSATVIAAYRVVGAGAAQTTKASLSGHAVLTSGDYIELIIEHNNLNNATWTINSADIEAARIAG